MNDVRVNRWLDLLDRVGWTFIETFLAGLAVDQLWDKSIPWSVKLGVPATAALGAAIKVVIAQRRGSSDMGDAVPGQVLETKT